MRSCDMSLSCTYDEMGNEPMSFEDEVFDLTKKIANLQEQVSALNDVQATNENRYCKVKQENASLLSKIHLLEEHVRDIELAADERRLDDERRFKDAMTRIERDKNFECDQYLSRIYDLQQELFEAREEIRRNQVQIDKLKTEKSTLIDDLNGKNDEINMLNEEVNKLHAKSKRIQDEESANSLVIDVLNQELDELRRSHTEEKLNSIEMKNNELNADMQYYLEVKDELCKLRQENRTYRETNEELQAQLLNSHLEEGRSLIKAGEVVSSLANELGNFSVDELRTMLKEQQDCNAKLRSYIDGILLNIVENYPQLLEVKTK